MTPPYHRLQLAQFTGYLQRRDAVCRKLANYRISDGIDWPTRVEAWLSNFEGPKDQSLAFSILEKIRVISQNEVVTACKDLLGRIESQAPDPDRVFHLANQTSGQELLHVLVKHAGVRDHQTIKPILLPNQPALKKRLKSNASLVIWDTFLGTGGQLNEDYKEFNSIFIVSGLLAPPLRFAFVAGGPYTPQVSQSSLAVDIWETNLPRVTEEEQDLGERYAERAGATETNRTHETGALLTLPNNPPNNVPLIVRAKGNARWHPLLERRDTPVP